MSSEHDPLVFALVELAQGLDKVNVPVVLGGGMSHYLRLNFMSKATERYPVEFPARSTADLDLFLSSQLIVDRLRMESLRDVLLGLGYFARDGAEHFIFVKEVDVYGKKKTLQVDLLGAPPAAGDEKKVDVDDLRIKPKGITGIHGRITPESEGVEVGKRPVDVAALGSYAPLSKQVLFIPSAYNYLILKAYALRDQQKNDEKDYGRHHAFDMFATVARMEAEDWQAAKDHHSAHAGRAYLVEAGGIVRELFAAKASVGMLRLREFPLYKGSQADFDPFLDAFLKDMADLFPA